MLRVRGVWGASTHIFTVPGLPVCASEVAEEKGENEGGNIGVKRLATEDF